MSAFKSLQVDILVEDSIPFYSDFYRMSVILNNLISNSIKYLDQNKSSSFLNIKATIDNKMARIHFEDNGIGIDSRLMPKIFTMFFRATTKNEGSGLGLYIVKEAVEKLSGKVEITSELGKGTAFRIEVPNLVEDMDEAVPAT
jgi:signal transduction histidine kinase